MSNDRANVRSKQIYCQLPDTDRLGWSDCGKVNWIIARISFSPERIAYPHNKRFHSRDSHSSFAFPLSDVVVNKSSNPLAIRAQWTSEPSACECTHFFSFSFYIASFSVSSPAIFVLFYLRRCVRNAKLQSFGLSINIRAKITRELWLFFFSVMYAFQ